MKTKITVLLTIMSLTNVFAQVKEKEIQSLDKLGQPKIIKFKETSVPEDIKHINNFLKSQYKTTNDTEFRLERITKPDELGFNSKKLQQYYKGIKIEFGIINAISKEGKLKYTNGNHVKVQDLSTIPKLTEQQALEYALKFINAEKYAWEDSQKEDLIKQIENDKNATYFPIGELVIIEKNRYTENSIPVLAYKFDIYALNPISRKNYYIDASTGDVIFTDAILKHVEGIASTRYSGQRSIETQQSSGQFRLRDNSRGNGIITYNNFNQSSHTNTDYQDNDNIWTSAEFNNSNKHNSGLDAHWGAMMTYDYFKKKHNRNSINNNGYNLINFVNANLTGWGFANSDNAFWDGNVMTYGMGTNINPLVSLDVIAHEIGHGLDQFTSNLVYERESGAIDEGLSDIWAAMVEFYATPEKNTYLLGEDIGIIIRSMSNPKLRNDPDTYGGVFWIAPNCGTPNNTNDHCGVHTNSGILNHWFYLLAEGSSNTDEINDNGSTFSIAGIGKDKAAKIVFRAQTVYFTPTTDYEDARLYTIQAAEDLFGQSSVEASVTCQSWFAVGVGNNDCFDNVRISGNPSVCYSGSTTYSLVGLTSNINVSWSVSSNLQIESSNNTSITVKAINSNTYGNASITANFQNASTTKNIWVGLPEPIGGLNHVSTFGCTKGEIIVYSNGGAEQYEWQVSGGKIVIPVNGYSYTGGEVIYVDPIDSNYGFTVKTRAKNSCGYSSWYTKHIPTKCDPNGGGGETPLFTTFGNGTNIDKVTIFPNPAKGIVNIYIPSDNESVIKLVDINGRTVKEECVKGRFPQIDISTLPNNIYFLHISGEYHSTHKLIIQN
ncbi:MAG: M4 family metallopeptidase [Ignavibacteriales bacterium]|nr:M4 family metallopeptidase [Ignavibacteriales bacterium]MBN2683033.1 M4 family metallopeptidase [Bacteroidales bacterium]